MSAGSNAGAAQAAPISPASADLATSIGKIVARNWFERMGNHSETHVTEATLAQICAAAAIRAVIALEVRHARG